jgi:ribosomal protein L30/L7E
MDVSGGRLMSKDKELDGTLYEGGVPDDETFGLDEPDIRESYAYSSKVKAQLDALGLRSTYKPVITKDLAKIIGTLKEGEYFDGRMPVSLRRLNIDDLSDLHVLMTSWNHYLIAIFNDVRVDRSEASQIKEAVFSQVRMQHSKDYKRNVGRPLTDQKLSDLARYDRRFVKDNATYQELNVLSDCLDRLIKSAEANIMTVSREVARREILMKSDHRGNNVDSAAYGNNRFARGRVPDNEAPKEEKGRKLTRKRPS